MDFVECYCGKFRPIDFDGLMKDMRDLRSENEQLRQALEFYASGCIDHEEVQEAICAARKGIRRITVPRRYGHVAREVLKDEEKE